MLHLEWGRHKGTVGSHGYFSSRKHHDVCEARSMYTKRLSSHLNLSFINYWNTGHYCSRNVRCRFDRNCIVRHTSQTTMPVRGYLSDGFFWRTLSRPLCPRFWTREIPDAHAYTMKTIFSSQRPTRAASEIISSQRKFGSFNYLKPIVHESVCTWRRLGFRSTSRQFRRLRAVDYFLSPNSQTDSPSHFRRHYSFVADGAVRWRRRRVRYRSVFYRPNLIAASVAAGKVWPRVFVSIWDLEAGTIRWWTVFQVRHLSAGGWSCAGKTNMEDKSECVTFKELP